MTSNQVYDLAYDVASRVSRELSNIQSYLNRLANKSNKMDTSDLYDELLDILRHYANDQDQHEVTQATLKSALTYVNKQSPNNTPILLSNDELNFKTHIDGMDTLMSVFDLLRQSKGWKLGQYSKSFFAYETFCSNLSATQQLICLAQNAFNINGIKYRHSNIQPTRTPNA